MTQAQLIAQAVAAALGGMKTIKTKGKKAKGRGREKLTDAERAAYQANNDAEVVKQFTAAGYKLIEPRINVLTYNKWIAAGRLVKKGEKAIRVGPFALFHRDQTSPLPVGGVVQTEATTQSANVAEGKEAAPF